VTVRLLLFSPVASLHRWLTSSRQLAAIILGCDIEDGTLRVGTPLCVVKTDPATKKKEVVSLGKMCAISPARLFRALR